MESKNMDLSLKVKLNGKQLYETKLVKYLGVRIDNKLDWKSHIDDITIKLMRVNAMLYRIRDYANNHYVCIAWGQSLCTIDRLYTRKGWFILKNAMPIPPPSFSNQQICQQQITSYL